MAWFPSGFKWNKRPDLRRDCDSYYNLFLLCISWNKRPDLRRDCDPGVCAFDRCFDRRETNDLIYEGIATARAFARSIVVSIETNDLIYEGIATAFARSIVVSIVETNDLIYEGIATVELDSPCGPRWSGNKRPDLRRDCDGVCAFDRCFDRRGNKRPDLRRDCDVIYNAYPLIMSRNKRPDLRRDCDSLRAALVGASEVKAKQTTWFTKGLRQRNSSGYYSLFRKQTTWFTKGLRLLLGIYDPCNKPGKQTTWFTKGLRLSFSSSIIFSKKAKQTTWFTKGLRRCVIVSTVPSGRETNDLIYEGIATCSPLPISVNNWRNKRPDLRRDCDT